MSQALTDILSVSYGLSGYGIATLVHPDHRLLNKVGKN
jgi:hypothetical protein